MLNDMIELPVPVALHMMRNNQPIDFAHSNGAWMFPVTSTRTSPCAAPCTGTCVERETTPEDEVDDFVIVKSEDLPPPS